VAGKVRRFRKWSKGWSKNIDSELRNLKKDLMEEYDLLDIIAETEELATEEHARLKFIYREMSNLWLREEVKAKQRSRDRDIKDGDRNTRYFHIVANQRRRKMLVHSLDGPDGPVTDEVAMLHIATNFYKDLFKKEEESRCHLANDFAPHEQITEEQNSNLESPFTEKEVKKAIFYSYSDGCPGPDGLPFLLLSAFLGHGASRYYGHAF
jgi:mannosylglycoprotein endo-beta-mannosidase